MTSKPPVIRLAASSSTEPRREANQRSTPHAPGAAPAVSDETQPLRHLVYLGRLKNNGRESVHAERTANTLRSIASGLGIQSVFAHQRDGIIHWLQGPAAAVQDLFQQAAEDAGFSTVVVLHDGTGGRLLHHPWLAVRGSNTESAQSFDQRVQQMITRAVVPLPCVTEPLLIPFALLRAFLFPPASHLPAMPLASGRKLRIVLSADDLLWPSAVVHAAARRHGSPLSRVHLAPIGSGNSDESEAEMVEYADFSRADDSGIWQRFTACSAPERAGSFAEAVFASADLVVFLVRASHLEIERQRLLVLQQLPIYQLQRPKLLVLLSRGAHASRDEFLRGIDMTGVRVESLSLSNSDAILDLVERCVREGIIAKDFRETRSPTRITPVVVSTAKPPTETNQQSSSTTVPQPLPQGEIMANVKATLDNLMKVEGAIAVALVDYNSGMTLGTAGGGINVEVAAAGNTEVVRAKMKVAKALGLEATIEDILITLKEQYHLIRPVASKPGLFIYLVVDRSKGNLGMARLMVADAEKDLQI